ncbi:MAG: hypothetical protein ACI81W_003805, partial [Saprospiraceae bacterium]
DLLSEDKKTKEDEDLEESARSGAIKGREH